MKDNLSDNLSEVKPKKTDSLYISIFGSWSMVSVMENEWRPFEAEFFFFIEKRRERLGYTHITNFYAWALGQDDDTAYRKYKRLEKTATREAKTTSDRATLSMEDAAKLARAVQMDLSDIIKKIEEKIGLPSKPFPTPDLSRLSKGKKTANRK